MRWSVLLTAQKKLSFSHKRTAQIQGVKGCLKGIKYSLKVHGGHRSLKLAMPFGPLVYPFFKNFKKFSFFEFISRRQLRWRPRSGPSHKRFAHEKWSELPRYYRRLLTAKFGALDLCPASRRSAGPRWLHTQLWVEAKGKTGKAFYPYGAFDDLNGSKYSIINNIKMMIWQNI